MKTIRELREYMELCYEEILKKKDVLECIVIDVNGYPIKSTMSTELSIQYVGLFGQLIDKARSTIRTLDETDEVTFMRVRTKNHEVIITPDEQLIFLVLQNPQTDI